MSDDKHTQRSEADAELEREIRKSRKFTLAEAIGRMAGPGAMKGVSPVTGIQQAVAEIHEYLNQHLADAAGALSSVLLRQVKESELLLKGFEQPLVVLAGHIRRVLDSEYLLKELVREADVEWGQVFGERPSFEKDGCPPAPDDPYTLESVRTLLTRLASGLAAADA
jgi:broad specificity phosphatase PhoE